jgi:hypothetical protein
LKGKLNDGRFVAVKQLSIGSHQGKSQFIAEIVTISAVQHRNLVKLYGCCIEGTKRLLVYEYLENKSLDHALFGMRYDSFLPCLCLLVYMNAYLFALSFLLFIIKNIVDLFRQEMFYSSVGQPGMMFVWVLRKV